MSGSEYGTATETEDNADERQIVERVAITPG